MEAGILAIWNGCAPEGEAEYERWYMREHLSERVGVPGFRFGRRYEALSAALKYFTFYETKSPEVLASAAYITRLGNPTAWTRRVMPSFRDMNRTVCRKMVSFGDESIGGHAVTVRFAARPNATQTAWLGQTLLDEIRACPGVVAGQLWIAVDLEVPALAAETGLRGRLDDSIGAALMVETSWVDEAMQLETHLHDLPSRSGVAGEVEIGSYRFLCQRARQGGRP